MTLSFHNYMCIVQIKLLICLLQKVTAHAKGIELQNQYFIPYRVEKQLFQRQYILTFIGFCILQAPFMLKTFLLFNSIKLLKVFLESPGYITFQYLEIYSATNNISD